MLSGELKKILDGSLQGNEKIPFHGLTKDTREKDLKRKLFIAIKGQNFDGHDYVQEAFDKGCSGVLVQEDISCRRTENQFLVVVPETLIALQAIAKNWRLTMPAKIIALTGSNGKTATKDFIRILLESQFKGLATEGNFNNHIGVPLTLARLCPSHQFAVIEMGMNHEGEIRNLVRMACPDLVLVTNVGRAHLEGLKELKYVAAAKNEIYQYSDNAVCIYNLDNKWTLEAFKRHSRSPRPFSFSIEDPSADVFFKERLMTLDEIQFEGTIGSVKGNARVKVFGHHHLENLMAASTVALAFGMSPQDIWKNLIKCGEIRSWGRGQILELESGARAIFDGYNANPESTKVLMDNVKDIVRQGRLFAVFSDMLELGASAEEEHRQWGYRSGVSNLEYIWYYGRYKEAFEEGVRLSGYNKNLVISNDYESTLASKLRSMLHTGDIVLLKGSRDRRLERVVDGLGALKF